MAVPEQQDMELQRGDSYALLLRFGTTDTTPYTYLAQFRASEDNPDVLAQMSVEKLAGNEVVFRLPAGVSNDWPSKVVMDVQEDDGTPLHSVTVFRGKYKVTKDVTRTEPLP